MAHLESQAIPVCLGSLNLSVKGTICHWPCQGMMADTALGAPRKLDCNMVSKKTTLDIYSCFHTCACACLRKCACIWIYMIWRPWDNLGSHSSGTIYFWDKLSLWPEAHQVDYADRPASIHLIPYSSIGTVVMSPQPDFKNTYFSYLRTLYMYAMYYYIHSPPPTTASRHPHSLSYFIFSLQLKKSTKSNCALYMHTGVRASPGTCSILWTWENWLSLSQPLTASATDGAWAQASLVEKTTAAVSSWECEHLPPPSPITYDLSASLYCSVLNLPKSVTF